MRVNTQGVVKFSTKKPPHLTRPDTRSSGGGGRGWSPLVGSYVPRLSQSLSAVFLLYHQKTTSQLKWLLLEHPRNSLHTHYITQKWLYYDIIAQCKSMRKNGLQKITLFTLFAPSKKCSFSVVKQGWAAGPRERFSILPLDNIKRQYVNIKFQKFLEKCKGYAIKRFFVKK